MKHGASREAGPDFGDQFSASKCNEQSPAQVKARAQARVEKLMTSDEMDEVIRAAENLSEDQQLQLVVHLGKKRGLNSADARLLWMAAGGGTQRQGSVDEEVFTGTWAYDQIWASLRSWSERRPGGREAFRFHQTGPSGHFPNGFEFGRRDGRPIFALVMRHHGQRGSEADRMVRSEIAAFFEDGAQVAWEVDADNGCAIHVFRASEPDHASVYRMGEIAEAEPALPGWRMAVSELVYHQDPGIMDTNVLPAGGVAPESLLALPGKSEIVRGRTVHFAMLGGLSGWAGDQILSSLQSYAGRTNAGIAVGENRVFLVDLPGRKSFSPTVAFYKGEVRPGYFLGAPVFAVEVRSGLDYGNDSWGRSLAKVADYFEAGTEVVWDVDVLVDSTVRVYRKDAPDEPVIYRRGEIAEAEPALPGWTMAVDDLFR